jgi:hypothetical protein
LKRAFLLCCLLASVTAVQAQPAPGRGPGAAAPAAGAAVAGAGRGRYIDPSAYDFNDHAGWQQMFDGKTLKGWDGPMNLWRVEGDSIVSSSTAANPNGSVYLFWGGGQLKDFEFKFEIKLEGEGANSGVQFRAQRLGKTDKPGSEWESRGYQADFDYVNTQTGALIECCAGPRRGVPPRPFKASFGMILRTGQGANDTPMVIGSLGNPDELKKFVNVGGWNQVHLIARGNIMIYMINGHVMSVVLDDSPMFVDKGELAIQLEGRGDTKVSYRNLWLKTLP